MAVHHPQTAAAKSIDRAFVLSALAVQPFAPPNVLFAAASHTRMRYTNSSSEKLNSASIYHNTQHNTPPKSVLSINTSYYDTINRPPPLHTLISILCSWKQRNFQSSGVLAARCNITHVPDTDTNSWAVICRHTRNSNSVGSERIRPPVPARPPPPLPLPLVLD